MSAVDANPLPSSERPTTAAVPTTVTGDAQQRPVVAVNEHHRGRAQPQQQNSQQQAASKDKTEPVGAVAEATSTAVAVQTTAAGQAPPTPSSSSSSRPICPNLPYSPACSPRFARRRPPLRECRVSVNVQSLDDPGAIHQKLNQYRLIDSIGQVRARGPIDLSLTCHISFL